MPDDVSCTAPVLILHTENPFLSQWILRFVHNCHAHKDGLEKRLSSSLSAQEVIIAKEYWIRFAQLDNFAREIAALESNHSLPESSCLLPLRPFLGLQWRPPCWWQGT